MSRVSDADMQLVREIESFLPALRMLVSRLRRDGSVIGQDDVDLVSAAGLLETAAGRLLLRVNGGLALDCEGADAIGDAERVWPNG